MGAFIPANADPSARKPIVVFCGKGGVGKTTLSLALGLGCARNGKRVVVVSSHPLTELGLSASLEGLRERDPAGAANLTITYIEPRDILAAMFQAQFPSQILARSVISSRIYKSLIEVAPGLKELAFLSRLRELAEAPSPADGRPMDLLIWDAPATGHFLQTLKASQTFDTYLSGPFANTGRELQRFFADKAHLSIVPVTTLEEMAVQESTELCWRLQGELHMEPAGVACNLVSPMLQASGEAGQESDGLAGLSPRAAADLAFVLDRHRIEQHEYGKLRSALHVPCYLVRRVSHWDSDVELLLAISEQMLSPAGPR